MLGTMEEKNRLAIAAIALAAICGIAVANYSSVHSALTPWYEPIVSQDEVQMALWADANLPPRTLYAADLFACEMLTATARGVCSIGGAWELADNANQRFSENEKAFLSNSSQEAWGIFKKYGSQYVLAAPRTGFYAYGYKQPANEKFENLTYFQAIYQIGEVKLYKVA